MHDADKSAQIQRWDTLSVQPIDTSVIDPRDRRGQKNRYIAELRDYTIVDALRRRAADGPVLDLGCGTGGLTAAVSQLGQPVLGIDISAGLLRRTGERRYGAPALFVRYGGEKLPVRDGSMAAATTYGVLIHILDDADLVPLLSEIRRVLQPGGVLVAGEQVRPQAYVDRDDWKHQRTIAAYGQLFEAAGLEMLESPVIRYARFPTTYALRYGVLPPSLHAPLRRLERRVGSWLGPVSWSYSDVCFVARRKD